MTIRAKLTLWYAGILFISVLLITAFAHKKIAHEEKLINRSRGIVYEDDAWEDALDITLTCAVPAAAVGLLGGWFLMRKALAPITALTQAAARINEGNLAEQLPSSGNGDELDRLTKVFNAMIARLNNSFQRIREFTLHASHELKTPLTVIHGELEMALNGQAPDSRERLLSQLDEIQRLTKIVDGLSLMTKADAGLIKLKHEPVRFDELVRENFADAQILGLPYGVKPYLRHCAKAIVLGDRHRLRQLLLNLTDNAIKYNHPQGVVFMELNWDREFAELRMVNSGPPIPPEIQNRVFDRFFRGDPSHGNAIEGCGLGLSIAQWIVTAHGGTIQLSSDVPQPSQSNVTTFVTVRLPITNQTAIDL